MAPGEGPEQTTVSDRGTVTIPAELRRRLDIEPGDTLRWSADDEGHLFVGTFISPRVCSTTSSRRMLARRTQLRLKPSSARSDAGRPD
jgi:AbrB family looped-hinge helix DNA binding protein